MSSNWLLCSMLQTVEGQVTFRQIIFRIPKLAGRTSSRGPRIFRTRGQSPSRRFRRFRNRGRRCDRHPSQGMSIDRHNIMWKELTRAKSPRMVPGAEARGLVAPSRVRPVLTASLPCQTIAQMGPLSMSGAVLVKFQVRNRVG